MVSKHSCRLAQTVTVVYAPFLRKFFTKIYDISMYNSIKIVFSSTTYFHIYMISAELFILNDYEYYVCTMYNKFCLDNSSST